MVAGVDEELKGQRETVLHEPGGDEGDLGALELDVTMADGAVAEIDGVGGRDQHLFLVGDGERNKIVSVLGEAFGDRHRHRLDHAGEIGFGEVRIAKGSVEDSVGTFNNRRLLRDLRRGKQAGLGHICHKVVF